MLRFLVKCKGEDLTFQDVFLFGMLAGIVVASIIVAVLSLLGVACC